MTRIIAGPTNIIVKLDMATEQKLSESIISAKQDYDPLLMDTGTITSIGPLAFHKFEKCPYKIGDKVAFNRHLGASWYNYSEPGAPAYKSIADTAIIAQIVEE